MGGRCRPAQDHVVALGDHRFEGHAQIRKRAEQGGARGEEFVDAVHVGTLEVADGLRMQELVHGRVVATVPDILEPATGELVLAFSDMTLFLLVSLRAWSAPLSARGAQSGIWRGYDGNPATEFDARLDSFTSPITA